MKLRWNKVSPQPALTPAVVITLVAFIGSMFWTLYIAFTRSRRFPEYFIDPAEWSRQYNRLFADNAWAISLGNVLVIGIGSLLAIVLGFILAAMIDREKRGEDIFRTIFLYPLAVSLIVTGVVWRWMFNPGLGVQNFRRGLGWESASFDWLSSADTAMYGIILAGLWQSSGFYMALTGLDPKDRGLAMVFQSCALYSAKSVRGNLRFGLAAQKLDSAGIEAMTMATRIAVMDGGVIQQIGTPDEIYETPATLFVAGFIGAPAMNILDATMSGSQAVFANGARIDLAGYKFTGKPTEGQPVKIGLRPEHFDAHGSGGIASFTLPVASTGRTGSDATIFLNNGHNLMAVRADPEVARAINNGDTISVSFPAGKANVFDARSGQRM